MVTPVIHTCMHTHTRATHHIPTTICTCMHADIPATMCTCMHAGKDEAEVFGALQPVVPQLKGFVESLQEFLTQKNAKLFAP